jgi:hypothetical protein
MLITIEIVNGQCYTFLRRSNDLITDTPLDRS